MNLGANSSCFSLRFHLDQMKLHCSLQIFHELELSYQLVFSDMHTVVESRQENQIIKDDFESYAQNHNLKSEY